MEVVSSANLEGVSLQRNGDSVTSEHATLILRVASGPDSERTCELLSGSSVLVGRGAQCQLRLTDPGVSRVHCRIVSDVDGLRVEDADSRYGTLVNGRPVRVASVLIGDCIALGDSELRIDVLDPADLTLPPGAIQVATPEWLPQESVTFAAESAVSDPSTCGWTPADLIGRQYVRFQVEQVLARSASGIIYRAYDSVGNRPVSLKIYWPKLFASDMAMSRFLRSMRAMVPLQNDHLIKLYAAGRSEGLCFTASEFVAGESAAELIERSGIAGMLEWRQTWRIAVGVAEAIAYLHAHQILHRSLHPANILIRAADGCVKLGDSVLAKSLDELEQPALTAHGDVVGDILYSSPEQLQHGTPVDGRSDLYSLGATLYALLTGRPPFTGSPAEVIRDIVGVSPEPPKQRHLSIPSAFEGVVLRLLAKRPEERFQTATALLAELTRVGLYEGLAISADPPPRIRT